MKRRKIYVVKFGFENDETSRCYTKCGTYQIVSVIDVKHYSKFFSGLLVYLVYKINNFHIGFNVKLITNTIFKM
jgi:hypothetical protein